MSYQITIGEQAIDLADDVDVTELKSEVVRNVHAGGGWVAIKGSSNVLTEVFVSAGQFISLADRG